MTTAAAGTRTRWLSVIRTASGGMLRHKAQSAVLGMVLLVSTASATLGLALLAASSGPFDHAFAAQRGADLTLTMNSAVVTPAEVAATAKLAGVTAVSGPFTEASVNVEQGQPFGGYNLAGRARPDGPVDDLVLNAGHWADGPGQVVLEGSAGNFGNVGDKLTVLGVPGSPVLTVVGFANSITNTADGWVTPAEAAYLQAALKKAGQLGVQQSGPGSVQSFSGTQEQVLYRFSSAASFAQLRADLDRVTNALPKGAVADSRNWLTVQQDEAGNGAIMEPFVVAFALIGLVMAVLIVANVVSGAVVAQYQRIGVLKSIGMTPGQVVAVYLSRIGWPALGGCLIGVIAGNALAIPVLRKSADAYSVGGQQVPWWASVIAPLGMLALTLLAALGPALRAGRLSAVKAIADGRAPAGRGGYAAHRLAARLPLPRPVSLGLAAPFSRPARTVVTLAALAFGATAVIFAVGLHSSLSRAAVAQELTTTVPVQIQQNGPGAGPQQGPSGAQLSALDAALRAQPGTAHRVTVYNTLISGAGLGQNVHAYAFSGAAAWTGYSLIAGRWYRGTDEVDVNTSFLTQSGLTVGDTTTLRIGAAQVPVRIVGEVFQPNKNPHLYGSTRTLPGVGRTDNFWQVDVGLKPGVSTTAYVSSVDSALANVNSPFRAFTPSGGQFYVIAIALIGLLSLMVAVAAALGVLNTVLMSTRDKVHDLGIFKSLGMRPGQLVLMVVCWIVAPAIIAGAIAAPAAIALNTATLHAMGSTAGTGIPASFSAVFPIVRLALLSLAALGIAVLGALLPASWAARARAATALRAE
ncbi:ABC transporter permease [Trebonia kvetii]|uniref:ABC transporter permease n=1 Tax=Trebonia kvetii TaxID=2480626 RepID=A0A6P2BLR4_9ACTN|nr:ABC transporter permease [Trebonia kvetii]TVY99953.1 ABC transporter permease [Trebonia kvetii]